MPTEYETALFAAILYILNITLHNKPLSTLHNETLNSRRAYYRNLFDRKGYLAFIILAGLQVMAAI